MKLMFTGCIAVLLVGCASPRGPYTLASRPAAGIDELVRICAVKIPHYKVDRVSVTDAIERLKTEWQKQVGNRPLPLVILDFDPRYDEDTHPAPYGRVTLEAKDTTVADLLLLLGETSSYIVSLKSGRISYKYAIPQETFRIIRVGPIAQTALGLSADSTEPALQALFKNYGVDFGDSAAIRWNNETHWLIIRDNMDAVYTVWGIVNLLEDGYRIEREMPQQRRAW